MGYIHAKIQLDNPRLPDLRSIDVRAMVDTGAMTLCIPEHIALQLKLELDSTREVTTADGRRHEVNFVWPIRVQFENRSCFVGALVLGDEVLLGAVPLEDMDLVVHQSRRTVIVNPESPSILVANIQ